MGKSVQVGPIHLVDGVTKFNFWTFIYAAFICIGMLAGMNFLQVYVITEHIQVPIAQQGAITGELAFLTEVIAIFLIVPFGILSDRIGRKPVIIFGILMLAIGYALFPFANTIPELMVYRLIFSVGAAALSALIVIVGNDYTQDVSRGRLFGFSGVANGLGVIFMSVIVAGIPSVLIGQGFDAITAGKVMFLTAAVLCLISGGIFTLGLKAGTPAAVTTRPPFLELMTSGLRAAKNPRIALSYGAAFAGRSDNAIKGLFISLWAIQVAQLAGTPSADALAGAGRLMGLMGAVIMIWMPLFGYILDRINRVTGMAFAMGLAGVGYTSMFFVDDPLATSSIPFFILLGLGQGSAIIASVTLVGQEAKVKERGTVIATSGLFGAVGILVTALVGGRLFDAVSPSAPFVLVGLFQLILFVFAVLVRIFAGARTDEVIAA
jgi:MFS family permease